MTKNITIGALALVALYLIFALIQCRLEKKVLETSEANIWKLYNVCLASDVQSRGAK